MIEGNTIGVDEPQPPYGLSGTVYNGLFAAPYNLADGTIPAIAVSAHFSPAQCQRRAIRIHILFDGVYNPQSGMTAPPPWNTYPYTENYFLSFERQLPGADRFERQLRRLGSSPSASWCIPQIRVIRLFAWPSISLAFFWPENLAVPAVKTIPLHSGRSRSRSTGSLIRQARPFRVRASD